MSRILAVLALILVALVGLGFYLGWFNIATNSNTREMGVALTIDKDKIKKDTKEAVDKTKEAGNKALEKSKEVVGATKKAGAEAVEQGKEAIESAQKNAQKFIGRENADGLIKAVHPVVKTLTLTTMGEGKEMTFQANKDTAIRKDGKDVQIQDLKSGDRVEVVYYTEENQQIARSITVNNKE